MPITLQSFLAAAQNAVIPDASSAQVLNELFKSIVGTISLDRQARTLETDTLTLTMTTTGLAGFQIITQALDSVSVYKHLSLHMVAAESVLMRMDVQYPDRRQNITLMRQEVKNLTVPPQGNAFAGTDLLRKVRDTGTADDAVISAAYKPVEVYPTGVLRIWSENNVATGTNMTLTYFREVRSTYASFSRVAASIVGFQGAPV